MIGNDVKGTIMEGIKEPSVSDITKYALFLGGTNATHDVLMSYDPLRTGYGRLFMVRKPVFLIDTIPTSFNNFKHILEYGNISVQGITDITMNFESMTGGYVGKGLEIPMATSDSMNTFTVSVYEFSGSPVRKVIDSWINGTSDTLSGLQTYNGASEDIQRIVANETAEFIYVATDQTGKKVEYACMLAGCFPETINLDAFQYQSGQHGLVTYDITFHCIRYNSMQINKVAAALLDKYRIMANSLNFYSGFTSSDVTNGREVATEAKTGYDVKTGQLTTDAWDRDNESPDVETVSKL